MLIDEKINELQNLTKRKITNIEVAKILGLGSSQAVINRVNRKQQLKEFEILKLDDAFKNEINKTNHIKTELISEKNNTITLDYYPDVFGSCGTGYFVSSEHKEQIQVPVNALFKKLSQGKKYSVINAIGNSMSPYIEPQDKLIVEHLDNQPIIDNHVYVFCYDNDLYIKRLYKNIDEIIAKSDNPDPIFKVKSIPKTEWNNIQIVGEIVGLMRDLR